MAIFDPWDVGICLHLIRLFLANPALAKASPYRRETSLFHLRSARRFARTFCRLRMRAAETAVVTSGFLMHMALAPVTGNVMMETATLTNRMQSDFIG